MTDQQRPPVQHQQPATPNTAPQRQHEQQQQANQRGPETRSKKNPGKRPHQGGNR